MSTPSSSSQPPSKPYRPRMSLFAEKILDRRWLADMSGQPLPDNPRFPSQLDPLRLQHGCVDSLRNRLHFQRKRMDDPVLETFMRRVFEDDLMVETYFQPRALWSPALPTQQCGVEQVPWDAALRAARRATYMDILTQAHERQMAYAASLLYSCGLFHCLHPWVIKDTGISDVAYGRADGVRAHLLEWNLHQMRMANPAMGDTLGEVFSQGLNEDLDPEQVSRIGTAVWIANRRIAELWAA